MSDDIKNRVRQRLLLGYSSGTEGNWKILGEDPNCDMGGAHIQPDLGTVSGRYQDVVEYALTLSNFIGWGYGGNIKRIDETIKRVPKGFSSETLKNLEEKKRALQNELLSIEEKIRNLDVDYE